MKRKTAISLTMALLMIISTFAVGATNVSTNEGPHPFGEVVKEVFNGEDWVDSVEAEIGDTLRFRINVTYHETGHENAIYAKDITIVDTLPACLEFADSAIPEETDVTDQVITWEIEGVLYDGEYLVIEFNATVVDYTDSNGEDNVVEVSGLEKCSDRDLYGTDFATVIVEEEICEPELVVEKEVWNGTGWDDEISDLELGDIVTFKITLTYNDCEPGETIVCLEVTDYLPCCLNYSNNLDYSKSNFAFPEIEPVVVGKTIYWNWTGTDTIQMNGGDQMVIIFDAEFVNYCEGENFNAVAVHGWTCCDDFFGRDSVPVDCEAPDTTFDKTVLDDEEWVDEIETYTGATLTFKLDLEYYGLATLDFIKFVDVLPCILEYVEGSFETDENITLEVSEDGKTLFFNVSDDIELEQGDSIAITFDVIVTGCTDCGCDCDLDVINYARVTAGCGPEPRFFMDDELPITSFGNCPPSIPVIRGDSTGQTGKTLDFYLVSTDPDGDKLYYSINTDDSTITGNIEPVNESEEIKFSHVYTEPGTYKISAMARDVHGAKSGWTPEGYEFEVEITDDGVEDLGICVKRFGIGKVTATLKNNMEEKLTDVEWNMTVTGGFLGKVNASNNDTIDELEAGKSQNIDTGAGSLKLANFGRISGEVTAIADGETYSESFYGFAIGKLVLITTIGICDDE